METVTKKDEPKLLIANKLSRLLADEFLLFTKTVNAQWNAEKPGFHSVQMFFVVQARQMMELMDRLAERIHFFGYVAKANLTEFTKVSHLTESNEIMGMSDTLVFDLWADHNCIIEFVKKEIEPLIQNCYDDRTCFFLNYLVEEHKKMVFTLIALS